MRENFPKTLTEQIDALEPEQISLFDIKYDGATVCGGETVTNYFKYMYGEYKTTDILYILWINYTALHGADFNKAYSAWIDTYNPLENYNAHEVNAYITNDGEETTEITHGKTNTITANDVQTDNYVTTDESQAARLDTRVKQSGNTTDAESGTTTTTVDRDVKSLTIGGTTYTADKVTGEIKEKHGNIGVTTSMQLLNDEVQLRMNPLIQLYLDTFINDYTYFVG